MYKKGIKKSQLIILLVVLFVVGILIVMVSNGTIKFETFSGNKDSVSATNRIEELEDGCYYIWHNETEDDIQQNLNSSADKNVFFKLPKGDTNWDEKSVVAHTLWFTSDNDDAIPTLYPGDKLIYVSSTYVPYEGISWEHFADCGYTIGVANMESDKGGHYYIVNNGDDGYFGYLYDKSDAAELSQYVGVSNLFLDEIGSVQVDEQIVSEGGTVNGLKKDKKYICSWYTGTYYQDYELKANVRTFTTLETFTTYDYEFLHSKCISITIPEWLTTGYYYLDQIGLFRYVSNADADDYNGKTYDAEIEWNTRIIIRDENGLVLYDPTTGYVSPSYESDGSESQTQTIEPERIEINVDSTEQIENNSEELENSNFDEGVEYYEDITGEVIIP